MRLGFSGMGNMASAIVHVILAENVFSPSDIYVYDMEKDKLDMCRSRGINVCKSNREMVESCGLFILAVKPQIIDEVLAEIAPFVDGKYAVSIAAGISTGYISSKLSGLAGVIRVMPNTPLMLASGATAIAAPPEGIPAEIVDVVLDIFSSAGEVAILDEELLNPVIGVNGSSPAFFFRMIEAIVKSAEEQGIPGDVALRLSAGTMLGSAKMLLDMDKSPEELIAMVSSKGGTTIAGLTAFDELDFDGLITEAMHRTTVRAGELSR